jgi:hypothetical protein
MPRYRYGLIALSLLALGAVTPLAGSAQSVIPNLSYVRDSNGQMFIVTAAGRVGISPVPASDDDIAAIPFSGRWISQASDGALAQPSPVSAVVQPTPVPTTVSTPAASAGTVKLQGTGKTQTLPFDLAGGAYTVTWQVGQASDYATYSVRLMPVVEAPMNRGQTLWSALYTKNPDASGETHIYDVKPGRYYLAVEAPKGWAVTFTPLAV